MAEVTTLEQQEYMSLAPGIGIVPEKFRNRGYKKLPFDPGEGGIGQLLESREAKAADTHAIVGAIGELVKELRATRTTPSDKE